MAPFGVLLLVYGEPSWISFGIGLGIALLGEVIRVWGVGYAGGATRKAVLEAPRLVTAGPYAYVRHPLYLGNMLMGLGGVMMAIGKAGWLFMGLFVLLYLIFYGTMYGILMPLEEDFLHRRFGEAYSRYQQQTPRLIPKLKPYGFPEGTYRWAAALRSEVHTFIPFCILTVIMGLKIR